ncbi:hypothetical protein [Candidatus Methylacidithermus pantelleriae]|uniref:Uncharacterized protein n=1 Tax=Candidatus Methylacidithermus pantelleriae TaxID=2744239 RepID=A0A8J2FN62_9BACT|nr:hypothetical protein [Candidatus Methylacidithermus pantelleriae]CAF0693489.1 hypothetical protein MPNT_140019 [Candidatus Methylacidithermus pantelleriae]
MVDECGKLDGGEEYAVVDAGTGDGLEMICGIRREIEDLTSLLRDIEESMSEKLGEGGYKCFIVLELCELLGSELEHVFGLSRTQ